jgi:predicted MPP superfamily phosphohydrolase
MLYERAETSVISRRKFLGLGVFALPALAGLDAFAIEPTSLRLRNLRLKNGGRSRFIHFSDFHYKGDARFAAEVVRTINDLAPDFACFTGDLVEDRAFVTEALSFVRQIKAPVYGVPGNHDYSSHAPFPEYERAFAATGGAWLPARNVVPKHDLEIVGMGITGFDMNSPRGATRRILLMHYPVMADQLGGHRFDLILAGHSHGGQVRLPFWGALVLPPAVGSYDLGYYETQAGPLYVNAGIGTYIVPWRFNCRPELTLITI